MPEKKRFEADSRSTGVRLDSFVADSAQLSRSAAQKLIGEGAVSVNGRSRPKSYTIEPGDAVEVIILPPVEDRALPQQIPIDVVYEDEALLIVNKPKGMVVHPAAGNRDGTLVNALLARCGDLSGIGGVIRPGIVHRLDKDTSGLLIVAKNDASHIALAAQIKAHSFKREYMAVLCGLPAEKSFTVDKPIARSKKDRKKMAVDPLGKRAVTHFEVVCEYEGYCLVRCSLETGRTHQIRVHAASTGHPVAGDAVYGKKHSKLDGQCLHAKKIGFLHPISGEYMEFDSPLPKYFEDFIKILKA